jgi:hypothetical protein
LEFLRINLSRRTGSLAEEFKNCVKRLLKQMDRAAEKKSAQNQHQEQLNRNKAPAPRNIAANQALMILEG